MRVGNRLRGVRSLPRARPVQFGHHAASSLAFCFSESHLGRFRRVSDLDAMDPPSEEPLRPALRARVQELSTSHPRLETLVSSTQYLQNSTFFFHGRRLRAGGLRLARHGRVCGANDSLVENSRGCFTRVVCRLVAWASDDGERAWKKATASSALESVAFQIGGQETMRETLSF